MFAERAAGEWLERLGRAGIPCGAVNDVRDVIAHPQLAHNGLVSRVPSPVGEIPVVGSPLVVGGERGDPGAVPALGEHTAEVLAELGL